MAGDPLQTHKFWIGNQTRDFKFSYKAFRIFQKRFQNRRVLELLAIADLDIVAEAAACGLIGGGDTKASADRVADWLDAAPHLFDELMTLCVRGMLEAYKRFLPKEDQADVGEAIAAIEAALEKSKAATAKMVQGQVTADRSLATSSAPTATSPPIEMDGQIGLASTGSSGASASTSSSAGT